MSQKYQVCIFFFDKLRGWHGIFLCYRTEVAALFMYQNIKAMYMYMYMNNVLGVGPFGSF